MSTAGMRSVLGRVGSLFRPKTAGTTSGAPSVSAADTVLVRPAVPPTRRWTTAQISVLAADSHRQLTDIVCRKYAVSRVLVQRMLRDGKIAVMRAKPVAVPKDSAEGAAEATPDAIRRWTPRENMRMETGDLVVFTDVFLPQRAVTVPDGKRGDGDSGALSEEIVKYVRSLILYQDERIIVLNKPCGLAVHSGPANEGRHLEGWLSALQFDRPIAPLMVHRLDKGTSGALVLARDRRTAALLAKRISEAGVGAQVEKAYWAMVRGAPSKAQLHGEIVTNIYRMTTEGAHERMTSFADRRADLLDEGKPAVTRYRWLQRHVRRQPREKLSLLELTPLTGRTHQLRVHLAEQLKLPIVGDYRYAPNQLPGHKLHLHCYRLTLKGWLAGGTHLTVKAPIPQHFVDTMNSHPLKLDDIPAFARK